MAYQTGAASSAEDLIGIISAFAVANGWTQTQLVAEGSGQWLTLTDPTGLYWHLVSFDQGVDRFQTSPERTIALFMSTGFNGGAAWTAQPGTSKDPDQTVLTNGMVGPFYAYHLFCNGDELHCVVEITSTEFAHLSFGTIKKGGTYTGGGYVSGTHVNYGPSSAFNEYPFEDCMALHAEMDGLTYYLGRNNTSADTDLLMTPFDWDDFIRSSYSSADGSVALIPITLHCERPDYFYSLMGYFNDVRYVYNFGLQDRQIITLGSEEWITFPMMKKGSYTPTNGQNSGYWGLAYRKVV